MRAILRGAKGDVPVKLPSNIRQHRHRSERPGAESPSGVRLAYRSAPVSSTAMKAFCGISTLPIDFIRGLQLRNG
ncbi:MAG: hypothetical protein AB7O68_06455 [Pirellulales bacterium]